MIRPSEGRLVTFERDRDDPLPPRIDSLPSSEAEARGAVEGFGGDPSSEAEITPRVRGGADGPHCVRGPRAGFFESFPFFQIGRRLQAFVGPVAQYAFVFLGRF